MNELYVLVGGVCDEDCLFCHERSDKDGDFPARLRYKQTQGSYFLTPETFRARLAELESVPEKIVFEGGEPTLHPGLAELVRAAREAGARTIAVLTNGQKLARPGFLANLVDAGLNSVAFSIHGASPKVHDALTAVPGSFDKLLESLSMCIEEGRSRPLKVFTHTVLNKMNAAETPKLLELLASFEAIEPIVLSAMYLQGSAKRHQPELFCRLSELAAGVEAGLRRLSKDQRSRVIVAGVPPCLLPEFQELTFRYPPVAELGPEGFRHGCVTGMQGPPCSCCSKARDCDGIWKDYADRAGWSELRPFGPARREVGPRLTLVSLAAELDRREVPFELGVMKTAAEAELPPETSGRIELLEAWAGEDASAVAAKAAASKPQLIVIAARAAQSGAAAGLAKAIKDADQSPTVLLLEGEGFPRRRGRPRAGIDGVLLGAGRRGLRSILERLAAGGSWQDADGIAISRKGPWSLRACDGEATTDPSPYLSGTLRPTAGCRLELEAGKGQESAERLEREIELLSGQAHGVTCSVRGDAVRLKDPSGLFRLMRRVSERQLWTWILRGPLDGWASAADSALDSNHFWLLANADRAGGFDRGESESSLAKLRAAAPRAGLRLEFSVDEGSDADFLEPLDWALSTGEAWWIRESEGLRKRPVDDPRMEERRFLAYAAGGLCGEEPLRRTLRALGRRISGPRPHAEVASQWVAVWRSLADDPWNRFEGETCSLRWGVGLPPWPSLGGVSAPLIGAVKTALLQRAARLLSKEGESRAA